MNALFDPATQTVALGTALLGATAGLIGTFAVVRRQSLQGDAMSHAALPGLMAAFLLGGRSPGVLLLGGAIAGWVAVALVGTISRRGRTPYDAALGAALAVFFGVGVALMQYAQKNVPDAAENGLSRYLFGQAATLRAGDVSAIAVVGGCIAVVLAAGWKDFELAAFDPEFATANGRPVWLLDAVLTAAVAAAVVIGLQAVGTVLMSTLLVAPAVAARRWSNRLAGVTLLAAVFGAASGVGGTLASDALGTRGLSVPTGPLIVLAATALAVGSLALHAIREGVRRRAAA